MESRTSSSSSLAAPALPGSSSQPNLPQTASSGALQCHPSTAGGFSSHNSSRKRLSSQDYDRSAYTAGHSLSAVVNDPRADAQRGWGAWLGLKVPDTSWMEPPPPIDTMRYPPITKQHLQGYLSIVNDGKYDQFMADRTSLAHGGVAQQLLLGEDDGEGEGEDDEDDMLRQLKAARRASAAGLQAAEPDDGHIAVPGPQPRHSSTQGDGLVAALQRVPALFFTEDFSLSRPEIFEQICGCDEDTEIYERIDKLNGYLDIVETQLMREIAARRRAVVAAGNGVHQLQGRLSNTLAHIKLMRETVSEMDESTYSAALAVSRAKRRRNNLVSAIEGIKAVEEVATAKSALPMMVESGDYAGALELLDNLGHAVSSLSGSGVACFRGLPPQLAESREVVEGLLQSEMLSTAIYTDVHLVMERAIAESAVALGLAPASNGAGHPGSSPPDAPFLAPAGGSLVMAEELSRALRRSQSSNSSALAAEMAAAREQLHDRLLPVVVGLYRCERLVGALRQFAANRCAEVKAIVREVVERLMPQLLSDAGSSMAGGGASAAGGLPGDDGTGQGPSFAEKLSELPHNGFMQILAVICSVFEAYLAHTQLIGALVEDILRGLRAPPGTLPPLRREVAAALQGCCDVAAGRWAKLLAARTDVHGRLRVREFRSLLSACEAFAALPEAFGCRPGPALRPTIQAQCRAYLDSTHSRCMTQLQHMLEAEQWAAVEVHAPFQHILDTMVARCPDVYDAQLADSPWRLQQQEPRQRQANGAPATADLLGVGEGAAAGSGPPPPLQPLQPQQLDGRMALGGRRYWAVNVALMLLKLLDECYLGLVLGPLQQQGQMQLDGQGDQDRGQDQGAALQLGGGMDRDWRQQQQQGMRGKGPAAAGGQQQQPPAMGLALQQLGPDVAQRCVELLRTFNTATATQVLGANAMKTAGLKSISAKHLALACQAMALLAALVPLLRSLLAGVIPDAPRRSLLLPEFDKLAQDLALHMDQIQEKLVDIMQERVGHACRQLSAEAEAWSRAPLAQLQHMAANPTPSEALRLLAKQLGTLRSVLQPLLQPEEVQYIFGRVAACSSEALAATLDGLPRPQPPVPPPSPAPSHGPGGLLRGLAGGGAARHGQDAVAAAAAAAANAEHVSFAAWDNFRKANALFMLQAFQDLPLDPTRAGSYFTRLTTFYTKHYGVLPPAGAGGVAQPQPAATGPSSANATVRPEQLAAALDRLVPAAQAAQAQAAAAATAAGQRQSDGGASAGAAQASCSAQPAPTPAPAPAPALAAASAPAPQLDSAFSQPSPPLPMQQHHSVPPPPIVPPSPSSNAPTLTRPSPFRPSPRGNSSPILSPSLSGGGDPHPAAAAQPTTTANTNTAPGISSTASVALAPAASSISSRALRVDNLVRPFTQNQLRQLLSRGGGSIAGFMLSASKDHCLVVFDNEQQARFTIESVNGMVWPPGSANRLAVQFADEDDALTVCGPSMAAMPPGPAPSEAQPAAPAMAQPVASQREATQPEPPQPEASGPEASQPEAPQPEVTQPAASQPQASGPEASQPEASGLEALQPGALQPGASGPEPSQPEAPQPGASQPAATQPGAKQPESSEPKAQVPQPQAQGAKEAQVGDRQAPKLVGGDATEGAVQDMAPAELQAEVEAAEGGAPSADSAGGHPHGNEPDAEPATGPGPGAGAGAGPGPGPSASSEPEGFGSPVPVPREREGGDAGAGASTHGLVTHPVASTTALAPAPPSQQLPASMSAEAGGQQPHLSGAEGEDLPPAAAATSPHELSTSDDAAECADGAQGSAASAPHDAEAQQEQQQPLEPSAVAVSQPAEATAPEGVLEQEQAAGLAASPPPQRQPTPCTDVAGQELASVGSADSEPGSIPLTVSVSIDEREFAAAEPPLETAASATAAGPRQEGEPDVGEGGAGAELPAAAAAGGEVSASGDDIASHQPAATGQARSGGADGPTGPAAPQPGGASDAHSQPPQSGLEPAALPVDQSAAAQQQQVQRHVEDADDGSAGCATWGVGGASMVRGGPSEPAAALDAVHDPLGVSYLVTATSGQEDSGYGAPASLPCDVISGHAPGDSVCVTGGGAGAAGEGCSPHPLTGPAGVQTLGGGLGGANDMQDVPLGSGYEDGCGYGSMDSNLL